MPGTLDDVLSASRQIDFFCLKSCLSIALLVLFRCSGDIGRCAAVGALCTRSAINIKSKRPRIPN